MVSSHVTSMLVMGILAGIVIAAIARSRPWHQYSPRATSDTEAGWSPDDQDGQSVLSGTGLWAGAFVLLSVGAIAGVVVFVSNPAAPTGLLSGPIAVAAGLFVAVYVVLGVYITATQRGHPKSLAAAETATVTGALFLLAVATQLIGA
ncbi:hypothetical protein BRC91_03420 [Halobacteriales archaeon QS_4_62_28]|nr:MAG: hypothetical protein BRC91_03420 [Halobacteriales archaeon QS_4_62_28]